MVLVVASPHRHILTLCLARVNCAGVAALFALQGVPLANVLQIDARVSNSSSYVAAKKCRVETRGTQQLNTILQKNACRALGQIKQIF